MTGVKIFVGYNYGIMRKRLARIAIVIATIPIHGQQESRQPTADQKQGSDTTGPPPSAIIQCKVEPNGTTIKCDYAQTDAQSYLRRLSSAENLPNLLLVLIGLFGIGAAVATLRAIKRQADTFVSKERARIQIKPLPFDTVLPDDEPNKVMLEFLNIGPTYAFSVIAEAGARVTVTGMETEEGEYIDLAIPTVLKPEVPESSWAVACFPRQWEKEVMFEKAKIRVEVVGEVRYEDVFGDPHAQPFAYRLFAYDLGHLPNNTVKLKLMRDWHPFAQTAEAQQPNNKKKADQKAN